MQVVDEIDPSLETLNVSEEEAAVSLQDVHQNELEILLVALRVGLCRVVVRDLELYLRKPVVADVNEEVRTLVRHLAIEEVQDLRFLAVILRLRDGLGCLWVTCLAFDGLSGVRSWHREVIHQE